MSSKKLVVILLLAVTLITVLYVSVNPISVMVLELSYTTYPVIVNEKLQDINFTFRLDQYSRELPTYQLGQAHVEEGSNKLSFWDLNLNFTLNVEIYREPTNQTLENRTLWRSYHFAFSSVLERKIQFYCRKPANATLGDKATIILDARLTAWYTGQEPYLDRKFQKTFTIPISD